MERNVGYVNNVKGQSLVLVTAFTAEDYIDSNFDAFGPA